MDLCLIRIMETPGGGILNDQGQLDLPTEAWRILHGARHMTLPTLVPKGSELGKAVHFCHPNAQVGLCRLDELLN